MNNFEYGNSEMLTMLLDGELDSTGQEHIFRELAGSEELRAEFNELMAIRESVQNDDEAYVPPLAATAGVFTRLGMSTPAGVAAGVAVGSGVTAFIGNILSKAWVPMLAALFATIATSLIFWNNAENTNAGISSEIDFTQNDQGQIVEPSEPIVAQNAVNPDGIAHSSSTENPVANDQMMMTGDLNPSSVAFFNSDNQKDNTQEVKENKNLSQAFVEHRNTEYPTNSFKAVSPSGLSTIDAGELRFNYGSSLPGEINAVEYQRINYDIKDKLGWKLMIRGMTSASFPKVDLPSDDNIPFSNFGFGLLIPISSRFYAGAEVGFEHFSQKFYNGPSGNMMLYERNPRVMWVGISMRGILSNGIDFLGGAVPFVQTSIGGSELGPLGRLMLGMEYQASNGFSFLLGLDSSLLIFQDQGETYNTRKLGITYGMTLGM